MLRCKDCRNYEAENAKIGRCLSEQHGLLVTEQIASANPWLKTPVGERILSIADPMNPRDCVDPK